MSFQVFVFCGFVLAVVLAAEPVPTRPKNCLPGTTYKKECNICRCGTSPKTDTCSRIDCSRRQNNIGSKSNITKKPSTGERPGSCPAIAAAPPGNTDCSRRTQTSQCQVDKDCSGAKRCCKNGCGILLCRNAIYRNTP